jgi:(p)ppGpp synthase/HD superfamily hydrolase
MTTSTDIVVIAREIATAAHAGQYRRHRDGHPSNEPYIRHPGRVASRFDLDGDHKAAAVAWLHDVLEDRPQEWTVEKLRENGLPSDVVAAIAILTRRKGEDYEEYLAHVKANDLARRVKIRDIIDNLNSDPTDAQLKKYSKALVFLIE